MVYGYIYYTKTRLMKRGKSRSKNSNEQEILINHKEGAQQVIVA